MPEQQLDEKEQAICDFVVAYLGRRMQALNLSDLAVDHDLNMIESGLLDSIGFIELITEVEQQFDLEVELGGRDPGYFTTVAGFARTAAESG